MKGLLSNVNVSSLNKEVKITFTFQEDFNTVVELASNLFNKECEVKFKKYSKKRSFDSNSFLWATINDMSQVTHTPPTEIYEECLRKYSSILPIAFKPEVDPVLFFEHIEFWKDGELNGKPCKWWKVYKGTSKMEQNEFNEFIQHVLEDAHELGCVSESEANLFEEHIHMG